MAIRLNLYKNVQRASQKADRGIGTALKGAMYVAIKKITKQNISISYA